jgi:hypothetical protein
MTAAFEKATGERVKTENAMPADGMNAAAERGLGTSRWQLTDNLHQLSGYAEGENAPKVLHEPNPAVTERWQAHRLIARWRD